jgi:uncharacterized repeat protein (TIGR01451 family)
VIRSGKITNGNGIQDVNEPGIPNVVVKLYDKDGNFIKQTTTNASGEYLFNVPAGTYLVEFIAPSDYIFTTQNAGSDDALDSDANTTTGRSNPVTVTNGQTDKTVDAGLYRPAKLGDKVFLDTNKNGIQDAGEAGVSNVTVKLLDSTGAVVSTTTTNSSGEYLFDRLRPGTYSVNFVLPSNYRFSPQNQGSDDAKDSDPNPTTGITEQVTLLAGGDNRTVDAGIFSEQVAPPQIVKDVNIPQAKKGDTVVFTIKVSNPNNVAIQNTVMQDTLPFQLDYVSTSQGSYDAPSRTLTFNIGTMQPNAEVTITLTVKINDQAVVGTQVRNTAIATSNSGNAQDDAIVTIIPSQPPGTGFGKPPVRQQTPTPGNGKLNGAVLLLLGGVLGLLLLSKPQGARKTTRK